MNTLAIDRRYAREPWLNRKFKSVAAYTRLLQEVFVEARAMERIAFRQHPFVD
jgi:hypothetical protein